MDSAKANLGSVLSAGAAPGQLALIDLSVDGAPGFHSYGALDLAADSLASGLRCHGLQPGECVALIADNSVGNYVIQMGIMRAGGVATPLNPRAGAETLAYMLADCAPRLVFVSSAHRAKVPSGIAFIEIGSTAYSDLLSAHSNRHPPSPGGERLARIVYTSGSTGRPKGVMLSHDSQRAIAYRRATPALRDLMAEGPVIVAAPLFHMNALVFPELTFLSFGTIVLLPRFTAATYIAAIERHRVAVVSGVPTMLALIAQKKNFWRKPISLRY